jgi:hypothetical protein
MKTRHHRIPERATLLKEKSGTCIDENGKAHVATIRLWSDYTANGVKRAWFYCSRDDWRSAFLKSFTGRNILEAEKFWIENENAIQAVNS